MRGVLELDPDEMGYWQGNAEGQTLKFQRGEITIVDLSREDVTPYQVDVVLQSLGWEIFREEDGYDYDHWVYYKREGYRNIIMYFCGKTFELAVYLEEGSEWAYFKALHEKKFHKNDKWGN